MRDNVLEVNVAAVAVGGAALVGRWGCKQWKNGLRDVVRLVDSLDEAAARGEGCCVAPSWEKPREAN